MKKYFLILITIILTPTLFASDETEEPKNYAAYQNAKQSLHDIMPQLDAITIKLETDSSKENFNTFVSLKKQSTWLMDLMDKLESKSIVTHELLLENHLDLRLKHNERFLKIFDKFYQLSTHVKKMSRNLALTSVDYSLLEISCAELTKIKNDLICEFGKS